MYVASNRSKTRCILDAAEIVFAPIYLRVLVLQVVIFRSVVPQVGGIQDAVCHDPR